jgi:hypothetical protein
MSIEVARLVNLKNAMLFSAGALLKLPEQFNRAGIMPGSERGYSTGDVDRHRPQELAQLRGGTWIEPTIGAAGQPCDLTKDLFDLAIATFLEHEDWDSETAKLASFVRQRVGVLLHRIADKD